MEGKHTKEAVEGSLRASQEAAQPDLPKGDARSLPLALKVYGVFALVGGALTIVILVLSALAFVSYLNDGGHIETRNSTAVMIITIVRFVLTMVLSVMYIVLGVRLLRNKRRNAGSIAYTMIALAVAAGICQITLDGIGVRLLLDVINIIILVLIASFVDPSLADERELKRKLRQMEIRSNAEAGGRDETGRGYISLNFFNLFWIFVVACVLGLLVETVYRLITAGVLENRAGLLWGPFSPIYGFGAVLMTIALNRLYKKNALLIFAASAVIGGAFEYFVSWFMQFSFGITAWDYSGPWFNEDGSINLISFMNIDGRTSLLFMIFWGILGLAWIKLLLPLLLKLINKIPWNWRYAVTTVAFIFMLVDGGLTLISLDCWYQRVAGNTPTEPIEIFCAENFGDDFMTNRFQTMTIDPSTTTRTD